MGVGKSQLAAGTITFLFTDIEGSTLLLQAHGDDYPGILMRHREILEGAINRHGGVTVDVTGDSLFASFSRAADAVLAATQAQAALKAEQWPNDLHLRVRMGLHTGEPAVAAGGYVGIDVHRAARIAAAAHGGQLLCSSTTYELLESQLPEGLVVQDLGEHRLKDLLSPQRLFQIDAAESGEIFPPLRSLEGFRHNLPFQVNEIVGRREVTREIYQLLETNRLITLVGPGGIGKTRLALEVSAEALDRFDDGVWYVELASLSDPELLSQSIAAVLGLRDPSAGSFDDLLIDYLGSRRLLLLLDNCEHLLDACALLSNRLLQACGELHILATSREAFAVTGEWVKRVPPLDVPSRDTLDLETIARSQAVRLFMERARAAAGPVSLTPENAPAVAEICRRLDGIPLAIELAASRARMLAVEEIARRLDDRFKLLTGGSRTALPRQQTLKALIDWSYGLLSETERVMLRRLSVFCCSWTLEAAERVCSGAEVAVDEVLDLVTTLSDKSLVSVETGSSETRYRLLETIRQYAQEKLLEEGESQSVRDLHLEYFLDFAQRADTMLRGAQQEEWLERLDRQEDELRAALEWASTAGFVELLERLAAALWRYWRMRSSFREGRGWLERALSLAAERSAGAGEEVLLRARCMIGAGSLANYQGDYERAVELLSESLELCRRIGDRQGAANSLNILAHARMMTGDVGTAQRLLEESVSIFTALDDKRGIAYARYFLGSLMVTKGEYRDACRLLESGLLLLEELEDSWWIENGLLELGWANSRMGELPRALEVLDRALTIGRSFNDRRGTARAVMHIAGIKLSQGELKKAAAHYRDSLAVFSEIGDKWGVASCIEGVAAVVSKESDDCDAAIHLGAAAAIRETLKATVLALERREHDTLVEEVRESLGEEDFVRLFAQGHSRSFREAVDGALSAAL